LTVERLLAEGHFIRASTRGNFVPFFELSCRGRWEQCSCCGRQGARLAHEENLYITVGFSLKTDSEDGYLCRFIRFDEPAVTPSITVGF
jgi:hypothetical protein